MTTFWEKYIVEKRSKLFIPVLVLCICLFSGCQNSNKNDSQTTVATELETGNTFFENLENVTKISAVPVCAYEYVTEDEEVMSIGTDNDQYIAIGGKVYHRAGTKANETLAGIFKSVWDDYGTK